MQPEPTTAAGWADDSTSERSARASKQLRDRFGRWIEMGGLIKFDLPDGSHDSGHVTGINGSNVTVKSNKTGQDLTVPGNTVQAVPEKARLDAPATSAPTAPDASVPSAPTAIRDSANDGIGDQAMEAHAEMMGKVNAPGVTPQAKAQAIDDYAGQLIDLREEHNQNGAGPDVADTLDEFDKAINDASNKTGDLGPADSATHDWVPSDVDQAFRNDASADFITLSDPYWDTQNRQEALDQASVDAYKQAFGYDDPENPYFATPQSNDEAIATVEKMRSAVDGLKLDANTDDPELQKQVDDYKTFALEYFDEALTSLKQKSASPGSGAGSVLDSPPDLGDTDSTDVDAAHSDLQSKLNASGATDADKAQAYADYAESLRQAKGEAQAGYDGGDPIPDSAVETGHTLDESIDAADAESKRLSQGSSASDSAPRNDETSGALSQPMPELDSLRNLQSDLDSEFGDVPGLPEEMKSQLDTYGPDWDRIDAAIASGDLNELEDSVGDAGFALTSAFRKWDNGSEYSDPNTDGLGDKVQERADEITASIDALIAKLRAASGVQASAVVAAGGAPGTPGQANPLYLAIVDDVDTQAVLDIIALVPADDQATDVSAWKRSGGAWVEAPDLLAQMRSTTPPSVVQLTDTAQIKTVLSQVDASDSSDAGPQDENTTEMQPVAASAWSLSSGSAWGEFGEIVPIYDVRGNILSAAFVAAGVPGIADTPSDHEAVKRLQRYWSHGEGAAKIGWGTPGDLTRCHQHISKFMAGDRAWGFCQLRHRDATGTWNKD